MLNYKIISRTCLIVEYERDRILSGILRTVLKSLEHVQFTSKIQNIEIISREWEY